MEPNTLDRLDRDRDVARALRLRTGLVSVGVIGSIGVAGAIGYHSAVAHSSTHTSSSAPSGSGSTFSVPSRPSSGDDGGQSDDGGGFGNVPAPSLQQGSGGAPQGQTAGS